MKNKNVEVVEVPFKKRFRTLYDTLGFKDDEPGGGPDMTDPSEYIPTEKLVARFLSGEIVASSTPVYEFNSNVDDNTAVEKEFAHAQADEDFAEKVSVLGSEGLRKVQQQAISKANKKPDVKKNDDKKETSRKPSKDFEEGQDGRQDGKTVASDKPSGSSRTA